MKKDKRNKCCQNNLVMLSIQIIITSNKVLQSKTSKLLVQLYSIVS